VQKETKSAIAEPVVLRRSINWRSTDRAGEKAAPELKREDDPRFGCETTSIFFDCTFDGNGANRRPAQLSPDTPWIV